MALSGLFSSWAGMAAKAYAGRVHLANAGGLMHSPAAYMNDDKRKFLFVSITGLISDIAWQVVKEGQEVRYFIADAKESDIADGFVPKIQDWESEVDWADVIVFDDTLGQGEKAQALRAKG